ncbi:MAG: tRNA (guanine(10)-N(2))-dimethyltransferase [Promethearchaeota archaeon]
MNEIRNLNIVNEGNSKFFVYLIPESKSDVKWERKGVPTKAMPVFYNPHMKINRDLSVLAVKAWHEITKKQIRIADVFCGSGIRGIRYINSLNNGEVKVEFVDLNPLALKTCDENLDLNEISKKEHGLNVEDANVFLHRHSLDEQDRFDIVDLDPFGNPTSFIASAIKSLKKKGGMLQVNATDLAVLAGVHWKATRRKYLVKPVRNVSYHGEQSIRILLGAIARIAMANDCHMQPLMSVVKRHYVRVFVKIYHSPNDSNKMIDKLGYIIHCPKCNNRYCIKIDDIINARPCKICGSEKIKFGGPVWIDDIQDKIFCQTIQHQLKTRVIPKPTKSLKKIIEICIEEANMPPLSYDIHELSHVFGINPAPLNKIIDDLKSRGWRASRTQANPVAIKSDCSVTDLQEILEKYNS